MFRYIVLSGLLVVSLLAGGTANAADPSIGNLPDLALGSGDGASGLPLTATDAYNVMAFVKDADDAPADLTTSILNVQVVPGAGAGGPASGGVSTIDIDGATVVSGTDTVLVDVYGRATAGWVQYTVQVEDASASASDVAIAKYSTFDLTAPVVSDGFLLQAGGLTGDSRIFAIGCITGATGEEYKLARLDTAIDPASASATVDWSVWVSNLPGKVHGVSGADVNHEGIYYSIDSTGVLTLTTGGSISPGPWIVGILATNQGDDNDSDGSRILVATALLAEASPDTATVGGSITFDDIPAGTVIPAAVDVKINTTTGNSEYVGTPPDATENIYSNSHWQYAMSGPNDTVIDSVALQIVDLSLDGDLPPAAQLTEDSTTAHIAGGNAIKAVFPPVAGVVGARGKNPSFVQLPGFRLSSRAFTGIDLTDIITFSLSVATDAQNATDLPKYQMFVGSGWFGTLAGMDIRTLNAVIQVAEPGASRPQTNIPTAAQGWQRLFITYTPGRSLQWFNLNGDTAFDSADLAILQAQTAPEGWDGSNELGVVKVGVQFTTQQQAQNTVRMWLDNMCVHRSAYLLDLALDNQELTTTVKAGESTPIDNIGGLTVTGDLDGSIESYSDTGNILTDLSAIGIIADIAGAGNGPAFEDDEKDFVNAFVTTYDIASADHTANNSSSRAIQVILDGDDGPDGSKLAGGALDAVRASISTGVVEGSGDGIYALEAYVTRGADGNQVASFRDPQVRVLLQEVGPNWLGTAGGMVFTNGGLPVITDTPPDNWLRVVAEMYIPNCSYFRGIIQIMDTFVADVGNFQVPIYFDDLKLYKVGDGAMFFDADLFDGV